VQPVRAIEDERADVRRDESNRNQYYLVGCPLGIFPTIYEEFIYKRTYSRWLDKLKRRENFDETVTRYETFFSPKVPASDQAKAEFADAISLIRELAVMPSMRCLWAAGPALEREHISGYNCAYVAIDNPTAFAEILYILMNGTGAGFSVERQLVSQLPEVPILVGSQETIHFADSKLGWAKGYKQFINRLYDGFICEYDLSKIRPKGARLKTFGGRASGPEPLVQLLQFTANMFKGAQGRKLNSLEVYDIACMIANCVVVGGVRRSAGLSLSNLSDTRMRHAKDGEFWLTNNHRRLSNNSVAYTEKPEVPTFIEEWLALIRSGNGERGIVNREALKRSAKAVGRDTSYEFGVNPCVEVILRPQEFCNLTEVIVRPDDTLEDLLRKVRAATIFGTLQSTLTDFNFLREKWKKNCEEERLLGVSLTGLVDHPILQRESLDSVAFLDAMRREAHETAEKWAGLLGINKPKAITCVKPSGTVSQLVNCSSGLHPRYSTFYIRRVRVTADDPIAKFLIARGVPHNPEVGETWEKHNTLVFEFPVKAPKETILRNEKSALEQLEYWKMLKTAWCDHNPSITIYVKEDEWMEIGSWVYKNWDLIAGISFLPYDGGNYPLAPYEELTEEQYNKLLASFPEVDFTELSKYETEDETQGSFEMACSNGACELK
jgi:ribonucleoside-triphosphate reductase